MKTLVCLLAESIGNSGTGWIHEMAFGNGGTSVDPQVLSTFHIPNSTGTNASLYNQTFKKLLMIVACSTLIVRNKIETRHVSGTNYTDVIVTCLLDYGEPAGQDAFDTATDLQNPYMYLMNWT